MTNIEVMAICGSLCAMARRVATRRNTGVASATQIARGFAPLRLCVKLLLSVALGTSVALLALSASAGAAELTATPSENGVVVKIDGKLFAEYLFRSGAKPILWPIIGPTGQPMTRAYPMVAGAKETTDHPHQRSMWFAHGAVNGVDFWSELPGHGVIEHRELLKTSGGSRAMIVARNDWLGPDGKKQCEDQRTLVFGGDGDARWIDFDIAIRATVGRVIFGDTKEGTFGLRVADTLRVDSRQGGRIVNSVGQSDDAAWGRRAAWVDYSGPIDGQTIGIAILNHPTSFRFPTYWHVRTYGLFAANPFGLHDFAGVNAFNRTGGDVMRFQTRNDAIQPAQPLDGSYTLPKGGTLALRYRVILHRGNAMAANLSRRQAEYARETK